MNKNQIISQRLSLLKNEVNLAKNGTETVEAFWNEIRSKGTPLIEPHPHSSDQSLVTFLWEGSQETKNVVIVSNIADFDLTKAKMSKIDGTNIWFRTYEVRNDLRTTYQISPNDPLKSLEELSENKDWDGIKSLTKNWQRDPKNPLTLIFPALKSDPELKVSIVELPKAPTQPWIKKQPHVKSGSIERHSIKSEILKNERDVWIYKPHGYSSTGNPYPLLLVFDGEAYTNVVPTPTILDNLISSKKIPPVVGVFVSSLKMPVRNQELPCYPPFLSFLKDELIPWFSENLNLSKDPSQRIVAGSSYGGLAAGYVAYSCPDQFGCVLSQSGSFAWRSDPSKESGWLIRQFAISPKLPIKFYLEAGLLERHYFAESDGSILNVNRHMRNVLQAKGYELTYHEFCGGHDYVCWRGSLADGLMSFIGIQ